MALHRTLFLTASLAVMNGGVRGQSVPVPAPNPSAVVEAMLRDGLNEPAWKGSESLFKAATNAGERAGAAILGARAALGMGKFEIGLHQIDLAGNDLESSGLASAALFWKARLLFAQDRTADASRVLAEVDRLDPADPFRGALLRLKARCLLARGLEKDALVFFEMASKSPAGGEDDAESRLDHAALLLRLGRETEAEPLLTDLSTTGWSTLAASEARVWLGRLRSSRGEYEAARREVEPVATSTNTVPRVRAQAYEVLAGALEGNGDLTNAVVSVERMESFLSDPADTARARVERARLLILLGRVGEGAALLRAHIAAAGLPEGASQSQALIATAHGAAGRHEQAVLAWQEYLEAFDDPKGLAIAHYGKGVSLALLKRHAEAASSFAKAADVATDPKLRGDALLAQAESLLASGAHGKAREIYQGLLSAGLQGVAASHVRFQSAFCLSESGDAAGAEKELEAIARDFPGTDAGVQALRRIATLREQRGAWGEAIEAYQNILLNHPAGQAWENIRLHLGIVRYRQGEFEKALLDFEAAAALTGEDAERAVFLRAWTLFMMGRTDEGISLAGRFLELHPRSVWSDDVLYWIGEVRFNQGDYAGAEEMFRRLIREFPDEPAAADAMFWAGRAAAAQKQYLRAMETFSRFFDRYPDSPRVPDALFHEADALAALGKFPAAILVFGEIIKNHPRSSLVPAAWGRKGDCSFTLGASDPQRYAEAARAYQFLIESRDTPPDIRWQAEYKLGQTLEKQGDADSALQHLLSVVYGVTSETGRMDPAAAVWFARAVLDAGTMLEARSRRPEAVALYRKLADAGLSASEEAAARIRKLQSSKAAPPRASGS